MDVHKRAGFGLLILFFVLGLFLPLAARVTDSDTYVEKKGQVSDHFDGTWYFNPDIAPDIPSPPGQAARWIWNWLFRTDRPKWPDQSDFIPGPPPITRAAEDSLYITPVGHGTFLVQIDGVNILTDPIWSERCSPLSWVGPKRKHDPGIRFEDLPPIDLVLVSHNHYDHLDLPTLKRLAHKGTPRAIVPLGNRDLMKSSGIPAVDELDWWQSVHVTSDMTITLVPARHFSSRTLWDRNRSLWGGFVVSGPSGHVFYSGDTGYGPHFTEIARRFSPIRAALLPIAPFKPSKAGEPAQGGYRQIIHMGPAEAVRAHMDLGMPLSISAHYQVFQLGFDGFHDAVDLLASSLKENDLGPDAFVAPAFGQPIQIPAAREALSSITCNDHSVILGPLDSCTVQNGFSDKTFPLPGMISAIPSLSQKLALP